jgi:co-chaperonin GroES (HSP10)
LRPSRGNVLVKPVETAETFAGGVIALLDETRQRWVGQQCEVVAVGDAERCEDEDCEANHHAVEVFDGTGCIGVWREHPCDIRTGDWLLVRPRCYVATDEPNLWVIKQSDVLARLTTEVRPGPAAA